MAATLLHVAALPPWVPARAPSSFAGGVREELAARRERLDQVAPEALDLAADLLTELHALLWGHVYHLAGDRTPHYRRKQLSGEHALQLEDLCFMALHNDEVCAAVVRVFANCGNDPSKQRLP